MIRNLGMLIILSHLSTLAYCTNMKLLDMEAEMHRTKIWGKDSISQEDIKNSLIFLRDSSKINKKYCNKDTFEKLYADNVSKINDSAFISFAASCKQFYENTQDFDEKISIHMLFEWVAEKYFKDFKMLAKINAFKSMNQTAPRENIDVNLINNFIHADKHMNDGYINAH